MRTESHATAQYPIPGMPDHGDTNTIIGCRLAYFWPMVLRIRTAVVVTSGCCQWRFVPEAVYVANSSLMLLHCRRWPYWDGVVF